MSKSEKRKKILDEIGLYTDVGIRFAVTIIIFLFLGYWIDNRFGSKPVFIVLFVFLGASAGFYNLYRVLMTRLKKNNEKEL